MDWDADARFAMPIPTNASSGAFLIAFLTKSGKRLGTLRPFAVEVVVTVVVVVVVVVLVLPELEQAVTSITAAKSAAMTQKVFFIIFSYSVVFQTHNNNKPVF
jgi:competence protein ComGC